MKFQAKQQGLRNAWMNLIRLRSWGLDPCHESNCSYTQKRVWKALWKSFLLFKGPSRKPFVLHMCKNHVLNDMRVNT